MVELLSNFRLGSGDYGARYRLPDGTEVNVVTVFSGSGLAADTEVEAPRSLTEAELDAVLAADSDNDHAEATGAYVKLPVQRRF